ncbi:hypothetical protein DMENIID0001_056420 [Sergentomyia squamirostris]
MRFLFVIFAIVAVFSRVYSETIPDEIDVAIEVTDEELKAKAAIKDFEIVVAFGQAVENVDNNNPETIAIELGKVVLLKNLRNVINDMITCSRLIAKRVVDLVRQYNKVLPRVQRNCAAFSTSITMNQDKFDFPRRIRGSKESVWVEYIQLALQHKPLNLGQGFPDYPPPSYVSEALLTATSSNPMLMQYTRGFGHPRLVTQLKKLYSGLVNRDLNEQTEILVTVGAYEALFCILQGHIDEGDEVIIIEPFFDCYEPMVKAAGGTPRFIPLKPNKTGSEISAADWVLDEKELEGLFNNKTKAIILNTPHNPLGKVFNRQELEVIANLCKKWNVLCISDEVYEWMVFEPYEHIRICTLPGK